MKNLAFMDLLDINSLQLMQDSFSEYTGFTIAVVDTEGRPLTKCSGDFRGGENDFEVPITIGGKVVGIITAKKAPDMSKEDVAKAMQFLTDFSKALSILASSNYKKIVKSRKLESAARSQASYIVSLTEEIRMSMRGWIDFFKATTDKYRDMPEVRKETDQILAKGQEVYSVIDGVVDYIRLSGGNVEYSENVYDVKNLIEDIKKSLCKEAAEAGVVLETEFAPDLPETLMGNSGRIGQTVSRLMADLLKYTNKGGSIGLLASCESNPYACILYIKITGSGCCMDAKIKKMIHKTIKKNVSDIYMEENTKQDDMQLPLIVFLVSQMYGNISFEESDDDKVVFTLEIPQLDGEKTSA